MDEKTTQRNLWNFKVPRKPKENLRPNFTLKLFRREDAISRHPSRVLARRPTLKSNQQTPSRSRENQLGKSTPLGLPFPKGPSPGRRT